VLFRGVFLIALATLLFEITLIRVLSFTIWYHFAHVVISSALLGFGASGTLLAVRPSIGSWDLLGAGVGCAVAVTFMNVLSPPGAALLLTARSVPTAGSASP
jgi:hypothetical protein